MQSQDRIDQAVGACYDAILAPADWPDALHNLARSLDTVCCGFYARDAASQRLRLPASHDYRDFLEEFVRDGWWERDHRARRGWPMAEGGRNVLVEHDVASEEDRRTLPQYHDLYPRYDVPWWGAVFFRVDGRLWAVPFLRSHGQGPFSAEDCGPLAGLIPHLKRIVRIAGELSIRPAMAALDLLQHLDRSAMLLDWRGSVIYANAKAESLVGLGLTLSGARLAASDPAANCKLQRLVTAAVSGRPENYPAEPVLIRREGRRPLLIDAIPVPDRLTENFLFARGLLLLTDLDEQGGQPDDRLRQVFGLTPAEARLAAVVGTGTAPRDAARKLGITEETARTTLKRAFAKTGVSRQSEFTALLSRLVLR